MTKEEFAEEVLNLIQSLTEKVKGLQQQVNSQSNQIEFLINRVNQLDSFH